MDDDVAGAEKAILDGSSSFHKVGPATTFLPSYHFCVRDFFLFLLLWGWVVMRFASSPEE